MNLQNIQAIHTHNINNIGITGTRVISKSPPRMLNSLNAPKVQVQNLLNKNQTQTGAKNKNHNLANSAIVSKQDQGRVSLNSSSLVKSQVGPNKSSNSVNKNDDTFKRRNQQQNPLIFKV